MKIITTTTGATLKMYASAKEMPIVRYNEFNKYLLMDTGIGSDMDAVNSRYSRFFAFVAKHEFEEAKLEAENLFFAHYAILNKMDFKSLAFAALIHSIDERICDDLSDEGLEATRELIYQSQITREDLELAIDEVKKK